MYIENFKKAINRSAQLGLTVPDIEFQSKRFLNPEILQKLPQILHNELGTISVHDLHKNCLGIHYRIKPILERLFNVELYLTLGNAKIYDEYLFKIEPNEVTNLINNNIRSPLNIHGWLTLPSMEILDFTLPTTFCVVKKLTEGLGSVVVKHYSELTGGMEYEPMYIGEDFLKKIGALIEV